MAKEQRSLLIVVVGGVAVLGVMMTALWYIVWTAQQQADNTTETAADFRSQNNATAKNTNGRESVENSTQTNSNITAGVVNGLKVEAITVYEDAWSLLLAHNQFNDPPLQNNRMFMIKLMITNVEGSLDNIPAVSESDFQLLGPDNKLYDTFSDESRCGVVTNAIDGVIPPKDWISGNVCFQVPEGEQDFTLIYQPYLGDNALLQLDLANVSRVATAK